MNDNVNNNLEGLDLLNIISIIIQLMEIKSSGEETNYIHKVIKAIAQEVELLHKENEEIISLLKEIKNGLK